MLFIYFFCPFIQSINLDDVFTYNDMNIMSFRIAIMLKYPDIKNNWLFVIHNYIISIV